MCQIVPEINHNVCHSWALAACLHHDFCCNKVDVMGGCGTFCRWDFARGTLRGGSQILGSCFQAVFRCIRSSNPQNLFLSSHRDVRHPSPMLLPPWTPTCLSTMADCTVKPWAEVKPRLQLSGSHWQYNEKKLSDTRLNTVLFKNLNDHSVPCLWRAGRVTGAQETWWELQNNTISKWATNSRPLHPFHPWGHKVFTVMDESMNTSGEKQARCSSGWMAGRTVQGKFSGRLETIGHSTNYSLLRSACFLMLQQISETTCKEKRFRLAPCFRVFSSPFVCPFDLGLW